MALRRRVKEHQQRFWIPVDQINHGPANVFYDRLNKLLDDANFDDFVEELAEPYYEKIGRPGVTPGVYFRMLFVGYFEDIGSQRGIAWRCQDSRSIENFLRLGPNERVPDHSSLTRIRDRYPICVVEEVFAFVLKIAVEQQLITGTQVGVDATFLEANAAMKTIVRKDSGEDWKEYIKGLMREEGVIAEDDDPSDEELRRFDRGRKNKTVSNKEWESAADEDARIMKMKDGRTRMAYKAEHTVDLETEVVLAASVQHATEPDSRTLKGAVDSAQENLVSAGSDIQITEVAADKGYHSNAQITECTNAGYRTYIPEPSSAHNRRWTDKPAEVKSAVLNNRRRTRRSKSKQMQRERSERVERSFAHVCDSGGSRRSWLRGLEKANKRYLLSVAAHNLGLVLRRMLGSGKPREFASLFSSLWGVLAFLRRCFRPSSQLSDSLRQNQAKPAPIRRFTNTPQLTPQYATISTGC